MTIPLSQSTYLIAQCSLVSTKNAAVLSESSTRSIVTLLAIECIFAAEFVESLLAVLLGLFGCIWAV
jgi:hypothetical protein